MIALLVTIAALAALGVIASVTGRNAAPTSTTPSGGGGAASNPMNPGAPQPPGTPPPGKVWSVEHGHWHDANPAAGQVGMQPGAPTQIPVNAGTPKAPVPQPPGTPPPGKVWSAEHGHWHDVPKP